MRILLVDDDELSREALGDFLEEQLGHEVLQCSNGVEAIEAFRRTPFPMVIADIRMPEMNGIELLKRLKELPDGLMADVVLITGYADLNNAVQALRAGAYDYLQKPIDIEELAAVVSRTVEHQALLQENYELTHYFEEKLAEATRETNKKLEYIQNAYSEIIGIGKIGVFSEPMLSIVTMAIQLHEDRSVPILIEGETGTGKEIIARLIHYGYGDTTTPFISINCSAISPNLFESELFGYEGGSFTGARKKGMIGKLELAQGGTILLDEIGDLPMEMQPKLLRVFEEKAIYRIGGLKKIKLDVRIICATNRNLPRLVEKGLFRKDLFFRLNKCRIYIPPLRERKEDIAPLAQMFLERYAEEKKRRFRFIQKEAVKILEDYSWPGNVRELQSAIERVVLLYNDIEVKPEHLKFLTSVSDVISCADGYRIKPGSIILPDDKLDLNALVAEIVRKALIMFKGNKTKAARYLGITRSALRSRLKKFL